MAERTYKRTYKRDCGCRKIDARPTMPKPGSVSWSRRSCLFSSKRGIDQWVSWVLLMTFVILLGSIVSYWMKDYVTGTSDEMKKRASTTEYCDLVGIDIQDIVIENSQTLNMKVVNTYNLAINQIIFRLYDPTNYVMVNITNVTIKPNQNKTIVVPKNETTYLVEAVPVILDDDEQIVCKDKVVAKNITE